jgi:hypothetical protein
MIEASNQVNGMESMKSQICFIRPPENGALPELEFISRLYLQGTCPHAPLKEPHLTSRTLVESGGGRALHKGRFG